MKNEFLLYSESFKPKADFKNIQIKTRQYLKTNYNFYISQNFDQLLIKHLPREHQMHLKTEVPKKFPPD